MTESYAHLDRVGVLVGVHQLQPVVLRVDDDGVPGIIKGNFSWTVELPRFVPGLTEDAGLFLLLIDDEDTVKAVVYDEELALAEADMTAL